MCACVWCVHALARLCVCVCVCVCVPALLACAGEVCVHVWALCVRVCHWSQACHAFLSLD